MLLKTILVLLIFATLGVWGYNLWPKTDSKMIISNTSPTATSHEKLEPQKIFSMVNDYRVAQGLKKLEWNDKLCKVAKIRTEEIRTDYSHNKFYKHQDEICTNCHRGENIARHQPSNKALVDAWIDSPSHHENIIMRDYKSSCIATQSFGERNYAVQIFSSEK